MMEQETRFADEMASTFDIELDAPTPDEPRKDPVRNSTDCIIRELQAMSDEGITTLKIYYYEDIDPGEIRWWVDVSNDRLNRACATNWVWTVLSEIEDAEYRTEYPDDMAEDYEMVVDEPFSEETVCGIIKYWINESCGLDFDVKMIDLDVEKCNNCEREDCPYRIL